MLSVEERVAAAMIAPLEQILVAGQAVRPPEDLVRRWDVPESDRQALRRTIHAARYLSDPLYRRKISRQLNKGESLHALRRDLHYAQQGTVVRPHLQDQGEQAWCLTLLTNSVITWTTEYYGMAIAELRAQGRDELLSYIAPGHRENINFFGFINVDVEAELAKLIEGWRPLRPTTVTDAGTSFMLHP